MEKNSVIEKIQKLLSLANSSNEHEAQLAAKQATRLLTKYNLTMQQVKGHSAEYTFAGTKLNRKRVTPYHKFVCDIIERFFFVQIVHGRGMGDITITMIGKTHNIEVAKYVFDFLNRAFPESFKQYRKRNNADLSDRKSYFIGFWLGLSDQLEKTQNDVQTETGLVLKEDPDLQEFMQDLYSEKGLVKQKSKPLEVSNQEAVHQGRKDGEKTRIAMGMNGNTESQKSIGQTLRLSGQS